MTLTPSSDTAPTLGTTPESLSVAGLRDLRAASCSPVGAPTVTSDLSENVILTSLDDLHNWARLSSLWPLLYGTACCFIEFAALIGSRFDFDRFGLVPDPDRVLGRSLTADIATACGQLAAMTA